MSVRVIKAHLRRSPLAAMGRSFSILLLLMTIVGAAHAEEPVAVEVRATATPENPTIGSYIRYVVEVIAPAGAEVVVAQPAERIGDLDIVDFGTEPSTKSADGKVLLRRWWKLVAWSPGAHPVESPAVSYRTPGAELQTAPPTTLNVDVASLLADAKDATDIRDIKPPKPIPVDWRPYYWIAGVIALVGAIAYLLRWMFARRRRGIVTTPPPLPHIVALAALDALRRRRLPEGGAFKEYYSALTDIVRAYLEGRYRVRAPEMTTEEFLLASSRDGRLNTVHRRLLGEFLGESDLVKFAQHTPSVGDSERAYGAARRFVDETAEPIPETPDAVR